MDGLRVSFLIEGEGIVLEAGRESTTHKWGFRALLRRRKLERRNSIIAAMISSGLSLVLTSYTSRLVRPCHLLNYLLYSLRTQQNGYRSERSCIASRGIV